MTKQQLLDRVSDVLSGGELNLINTATTDFDIPSTDLIPAQSYLQGFIFAARNLAGLTDEDINKIAVPMDNPRVLTNIELIEHTYE